MTIQWIEGFEMDRHSLALSRAYNSVVKSRFNFYKQPGRAGGFFLRVAQEATDFFLIIEDGGVKDLNPNNIDTFVLGFAFRGSFLADWKGKSFDLWTIRDQASLPAALTHLFLGVVVASDGKSYEWSVTRGTTVLGTTSGSFSNDEWYYVEFKIKIHTSLGTVDILVDSSSQLALTAQNTSVGAGVWGHFNLSIPRSATTSFIDIDDIYIVSAELTNPSYLGSILIEQKWPNLDSIASSPGPYNAWTLVGANLFSREQAVNESLGGSIDDDLRYLEAKLNDLKQTFGMIQHFVIDDNNILAWTWNIDARTVSQGNKNIAPLFWETAAGLITGSNVVINSTSYMRRKVVHEAALSATFKIDVAQLSEHGFETKA